MARKFEFRIEHVDGRDSDQVVIVREHGRVVLRVEVEWKKHNHRREIQVMRFVSLRKDTPISATLLKQLPIRAIENSLRRRGPRRSIPELRLAARRVGLSGPQSGRQFTTEQLAILSEIYREATDSGQSPRALIAKVLGISVHAAEKRVKIARNHQLMGAAVPGVAKEAS